MPFRSLKGSGNHSFERRLCGAARKQNDEPAQEKTWRRELYVRQMFWNQSVHGVPCLFCFGMFKMSYTVFLFQCVVQ